MVKVREDMTGWNMWEHGVPDSRLTVIKQVDDYVSLKGEHRAQYLCKCNCGNEKSIIAILTDIKHGKIKSCGCLQKEMGAQLGKRNGKNNQAVLNLKDEYGEYGYGICNNTGSKFYFDMEDYDLISKYCWSELIQKSGYHMLEAREKETGKTVFMIEVIGCKNYDHIDRNTLNNRKYNLRPATVQENARNRSTRSDNTSGFIGVYKAGESNWKAIISYNKKLIYLGYFDNKEDAIIARLKAEKEYYGEFAPQRHLFEQYGI